MKKSKKKKILKFFMNLLDLYALDELYKETEDPIVKILLKWHEEYKDELKVGYTPQHNMYSDIIGYLFEKYKLREV